MPYIRSTLLHGNLLNGVLHFAFTILLKTKKTTDFKCCEIKNCCEINQVTSKFQMDFLNKTFKNVLKQKK